MGLALAGFGSNKGHARLRVFEDKGTRGHCNRPRIRFPLGSFEEDRNIINLYGNTGVQPSLSPTYTCLLFSFPLSFLEHWPFLPKHPKLKMT